VRLEGTGITGHRYWFTKFLNIYPLESLDMKPAKLVSSAFLVVGLLSLSQAILIANADSIYAMLWFVGGITWIGIAIRGFTTHEEDPIVTEYSPSVYVLLSGLGLWAGITIMRMITVTPVFS
jgi:hypothetical protein